MRCGTFFQKIRPVRPIFCRTTFATSQSCNFLGHVFNFFVFFPDVYYFSNSSRESLSHSVSQTGSSKISRQLSAKTLIRAVLSARIFETKKITTLKRLTLITVLIRVSTRAHFRAGPSQAVSFFLSSFSPRRHSRLSVVKFKFRAIDERLFVR